jgi:hypothetical protein
MHFFPPSLLPSVPRIPMKRPELLLVLVLVGFGAFVAREAMRAPRRAAAAVPADTAPAAERAAPVAAAHEQGARATTGLRAHERIDMEFTEAVRRTPGELDDIRRRVRLGTPGTWMDDALLERDSLLLRWRPRDAEPLRVWLAPAARVRDGGPALDAAVREAFATWSAAGAPVRVTWVLDSASADVPVTWVERFPDDDRVGVTHVRGLDGELVAGAIVLATHTRAGRPLDASWIRAIALHEVGHLLGLPHSTNDSASVMRPQAALRGLSRGDVGTMRLLYMVPFGSLRADLAAKP